MNRYLFLKEGNGMKLKKSYNRILLMFFVSVFLLISGCGTSQKTDFYQLEENSKSSLVGVGKGYVIGVGPIHIPEYINRPQIVTRSTQYRLNVSEFNRWIEPITDSVSRLMVINLSNNLNSNRIYWVPRHEKQYPIDLRVAIDIGRFDGRLGEEVILESRWTLFDKNDVPVLTKVSLISESVNGEGYNALVIAMNKALKILGKEISEASVSFLSK